MQHAQNQEDSLTKKANLAMEKASLDAVEEAKRHNTPLVIWEDNQIKYISADEMQKRLKSRGIAI